MVTLVISKTHDIVHGTDARRFCDEHVVIKKSALEEIKRVAIEKGVYDAFKALEVTVHEISPREGEGSW